jgi:DNA-binding CsgD family transcriptional regulator
MAMPALASEVVGRDEELAVVRDFLAAVDRLPSALLIEGEAGIGKTTLWSAGLAVAAEHGYRVLSARPAQAESQVSYAGLADLLDPVLERALDELPPPQRRALEIALVLRDSENGVPDQAAIAFALLGALRSVTDVPVVVAVDDLQWLDAPSAFALRFAARRLRDEPIGLLLSVRHDGDGEASAPGLLSDERTRQIHVGGLSLGALQRLIQARLDLALPRPLLKRLHETSAGNPFFALELAHALGSSQRELEPGEPLPVSDQLRRLIGDRLASLPPGSDEVLLVAAAASQPTFGLLGAVLGEEEVSTRLRPAVDAGLVELLGERVRFAHPLYASAVYGAATPEDKRKIRRRLAAVVDDPEERARHLAASAVGPNTDVAVALDEAVQIALKRGAPQAAAELAAHAIRLTPPEDADAAHRRRLAAGDAHFEAGDTARAHALFAAAADEVVGRARAAALSRLARIHVFEGDSPASVVLCRRALADVGDDLELRSEIEEGLAVGYYFMRENLVAAAAHARSAVEAARRLGRPRALAEGLAIQGLVDGLLGRSSARPAFEEALNLEQATRDLRVMRRPSFSFAVYVSWTDDMRTAKTQFESLYQESLERGDESTIPLALAHLSAIECALGDWRAAAHWADASYESSVLTGQLPQQAYALAARALVDAHLGLTEQARAGANEALQLGREPGSYGSATSHAALGLLALSLERPQEAHEALGPLVDHFEGAGIVEPGALWFVPDAIESLVELGEQEAATALVERFAEHARRLGRRSSLAAAHRCRGLLSINAGEEDGAIASILQALDELASLPLPFERARTLLALGSVQRRARQRRAARKTLEEAQRLFDDLGASLWSERTKAELGRISGRPPSTGELTASEKRVAELVAEGRTNKQVAATLHLTERTVEGTLSRVYAKLGIRSRTELAHRWVTRG